MTLIFILILIFVILFFYINSQKMKKKLDFEKQKTIYLKEELKEKTLKEVNKPMINWDHTLLSNNIIERKRICLTLIIQSLRTLEMSNPVFVESILNLMKTKQNLDESNFVLSIINFAFDIANPEQKNFLEKTFKNESSTLYFIQCINVILYSDDIQKTLWNIDDLANQSCSRPMYWKLPSYHKG